ncbi:MAG: imidazoleglycerol-phosphate dehydratase HisB [Actinomycetota bacterium]
MPSKMPEAPARRATAVRKTKEVDVTVTLDLDGRGHATASTGIPFFDHMLQQLGTHGGFDLDVQAKGDLEVDAHHTVEDTALAIGEALVTALGDKDGIARFGSALVPLDEALVQVALDLSARPFLVHEVDAQAELIGSYDTRLTEEFVRAFAQAAGATIHVRLVSGRNPHHIVEAEFKALARALRQACALTGTAGVPSTKGRL